MKNVSLISCIIINDVSQTIKHLSTILSNYRRHKCKTILQIILSKFDFFKKIILEVSMLIKVLQRKLTNCLFIGYDKSSQSYPRIQHLSVTYYCNVSLGILQQGLYTVAKPKRLALKQSKPVNKLLL